MAVGLVNHDDHDMHYTGKNGKYFFTVIADPEHEKCHI